MILKKGTEWSSSLTRSLCNAVLHHMKMVKLMTPVQTFRLSQSQPFMGFSIFLSKVCRNTVLTGLKNLLPSLRLRTISPGKKLHSFKHKKIFWQTTSNNFSVSISSFRLKFPQKVCIICTLSIQKSSHLRTSWLLLVMTLSKRIWFKIIWTGARLNHSLAFRANRFFSVVFSVGMMLYRKSECDQNWPLSVSKRAQYIKK